MALDPPRPPRLPVLPTLPHPEDLPCAGCAAPCCLEHQVPLDGYDLFRLLRGLSVPWEDLVELDPHEGYTPHGFRLGGRLHTLLLRRRPDGACSLLLELPGGHRRCGAYELRPAACRIYPLVGSDDEPSGSFVYGVALCPDDNKRRFAALRPALRPLVDEDLGELQLSFRVAARWNSQDPGATPARLVRWLLDLYGAIEPLRRPERGDWQLAAYELVRAFPLPRDP